MVKFLSRTYAKLVIVGIVCGAILFFTGTCDYLAFIFGMADRAFTVNVGWTLFSLQTFVGLFAGVVSAYLVSSSNELGWKNLLKTGALSGFVMGSVYTVSLTILLMYLGAGKMESLLLVDLVSILLYTLLGVIGGVIGALIFRYVKR